ncbi:MAG: hypothetical protein AAF434_09680 [Pseudomonadota bacterium]
MKTLIATTIILSSAVFSAHANQQEALANLGTNAFPEWLNDSTVLEHVKAQNKKNSGLSESEIIALDKQWRAETESLSRPLIEDVLSNALSSYLEKVKNESEGLYTEIFVMDNKGLNVGQSDVTSDYWQGDEAKWQKTYLEGPKSVHVGDIEMDESTQEFQAQVSVPVVDPASGSVIGAVTVGVNVDAL